MFAYAASEAATVPTLIREIGAAWADARVSDAVTHYHRLLEIVPTLTDARDNLIVTLDLDPDTTPRQAFDARRAWWRQEGVPRYARSIAHDNIPDPNRPLRVGYVSGDFRWHSAVRSVSPVILGHSKQIHVFCYSTHRPGYDAITEKIQAVSTWREVEDMSDVQLADQIRADGIDILVDLSGYTAYNKLTAFCHKPAPIQITAWGYATGLGLDAIDVLFSDPVAHGPDLHSERIVNLPSIVTYAPADDVPDVNPLPCLTTPPTFAAFHRPQKVNARVLTLWQRIVRALPESRILVKAGGYTPDIQAWMRGYLGDQVEFRPHTPQRQHLEALHECDLVLDTFPQNGCITTCDGLLMGVPPVTLIGQRVTQRTSASLLTNVGHTGFIAYSPDDYIALACEWVTDRREELAAIRQSLRSQFLTSPICNGYVEAVEKAYRQLWKEWCDAHR